MSSCVYCSVFLTAAELNFQVFALVPAVLFVYAATTGLYRLIYRRMSRRRLFHLLRLEALLQFVVRVLPSFI